MLCRPTKQVCGLPVCYFCLKAKSLFSHWILLSFLCKSTSWHHHWKLYHHWVKHLSDRGALPCLPPAGIGLLSLPGTLLQHCLPFVPRPAPLPCGLRQPSESFLPVLFDVTFLSPVSMSPGSLRCHQVQGKAHRSFLWVSLMYWCGWPMVNEKQVCHLQEAWFKPCILTQVPPRSYKAAEID